MKYMGSKARHVKHILPIMLDGHDPSRPWVEPFVGGANVICEVPAHAASERIGTDIHPYLIAMWRAVSEGWVPPETFTEDQYADVRLHRSSRYPAHLVGYVGFALSYGGKWFGGWCRDSQGNRDYVSEAYRNAMKQFPKLRGVRFECGGFDSLEVPAGSTVYCDPPYRGTTGYPDQFDPDKFYDWCISQAARGNRVFISEYAMPPEFEEVWVGKPVASSLTRDTGSKRAVEKLFTVK